MSFPVGNVKLAPNQLKPLIKHQKRKYDFKKLS